MMDGSDRYFRPGGGRTENADRDAAIYRAREIEGLTYRDIGSRFGLSVERVRLICIREENRELKVKGWQQGVYTGSSPGAKRKSS